MFISRNPAWPLSEFVESLWISQSTPPAHQFERILPSSEMQLIVNLRDDRFTVQHGSAAERYTGTLLVGPFLRSCVIDTAQQCQTLGVQFKAGGAFVFLPLPADELRNTHVSLADFWGSRAADLRERLLAASGAASRLSVVESVLRAQLMPDRERHPAVKSALERIASSGGGTTISGLANELGLSSRRLEQLFREQVGLTPKAFHRLQRFHRALGEIRGDQRFDWAELALACGYYDQAHFSHDFRKFSGFTPSHYAASQTDLLHHVPLPDFAFLQDARPLHG